MILFFSFSHSLASLSKNENFRNFVNFLVCCPCQKIGNFCMFFFLCGGGMSAAWSHSRSDVDLLFDSKNLWILFLGLEALPKLQGAVFEEANCFWDMTQPILGVAFEFYLFIFVCLLWVGLWSGVFLNWQSAFIFPWVDVPAFIPLLFSLQVDVDSNWKSGWQEGGIKIS